VTNLEMAEAIDGMERSVTSWEAEFLDSVLVRLREGRSISEKQESKIRELYERYLGDGAGGGEDICQD
jgi:hypothetical protein